MQVITAEQRSPKWFAARLGKATGSRFADVLAGGKGLTRKAYAVQLALEIVTGKQADTFTSADMQTGTEREPVARALYEAYSGNFVDEVGFCLHDTLPCGVSPDGLINSDGGVEIKCPKASTHAGYLSIPAEPSAYTAQIQGCMWVTGRDWWDFVSYHPDFPENAQLIVRKIKRDPLYIVNLEKAIKSFSDEVKAEVELIKNFKNAAQPTARPRAGYLFPGGQHDTNPSTASRACKDQWQIEAARKQERKQAIATIRQAMQEHGIDLSELTGLARKESSKVVPKYRDPVTGATWTGRGKEPLWIKGKERAAFAV